MVNGRSIKELEANMREDRPQTTDNRPQTTDNRQQKNSLESGVWSLESEKGMVLIVSLLLLLVATVVGITALSTSTTKVMIAGNQRLSEVNFSHADGGVSVSAPIIKTIWDDENFGTATSAVYAGLITDTNFHQEAPQDADTNDIQYSDLAGTTTVIIDIDRLYDSQPYGCGMGYAEGGGGSGNVCVDKYYRVNSNSAGPVGSVVEVGALYRYVLR